MSSIKATHDLLNPSANTRPALGRSKYFYLFQTLADSEDAGRFPGTDDDGTVARLKDFERAYRVGGGSTKIRLMTLPAAYTYFGQFLNHDISAPVGGLFVDLGRTDFAGIIGTADPKGLGKDFRAHVQKILEHFQNEHDQPMTLASLYGDGPQSDDKEIRDLYAPDGMSFKLAKTHESTAEELRRSNIDPANLVRQPGASDILRGKDALSGKDVPLIADRRNDGNLILSQLHLAFLMIHNRAATLLADQFPGNPGACFAAARGLVTRHYHWLILNDYLPSLLSRTVLDKPLADWVIKSTPNRTEAAGGPVPMEFTTAAFRFGHSMVATSYDFNENFGTGSKLDGVDSASLQQLFAFTSGRSMNGQGGEHGQLPDHWVIDWDRMTAPSRNGDGGAEQIDLDLAADMLTHVGEEQVTEHGSIMFRNLLRGFHRRIPFGQVLALEYGLDPLDPKQIEDALPDRSAYQVDGYGTIPADTPMTVRSVGTELGIHEHTPAWLYVLLEAQLEGGQRLGPTSSHIIADTIVGIMRQNPASVLRYDGGVWHPRDSVFWHKAGKEITSLRAFLLFATETAD